MDLVVDTILDLGWRSTMRYNHCASLSLEGSRSGTSRKVVPTSTAEATGKARCNDSGGGGILDPVLDSLGLVMGLGSYRGSWIMARIWDLVLELGWRPSGQQSGRTVEQEHHQAQE